MDREVIRLRARKTTKWIGRGLLGAATIGSLWLIFNYLINTRYEIKTSSGEVLITTQVTFLRTPGYANYRDPVTHELRRIPIEQVKSVKKIQIRNEKGVEVIIDDNEEREKDCKIKKKEILN